MSDETYNSQYDLSGFFGDTAAPADFNPNAKGFEAAPVGEHLMEVFDFEIPKDAKRFGAKVDGVSADFYYYQLRPKLRIVSGPHEGATIMDFIPIPPKEGGMATLHANEWANFIKSIGFDIPDGKLLPAGFNPSQMKGRRCMVKVVQAMKDGQPTLNKFGEPQTEVKFFGYSRVQSRPAASAPQSTAAPAAPTTAKAAAPAPATKAPQKATVPDNFDL